MFLWHEALPRRLSVAESERPSECSQRGCPRSAIHAWACALRALGERRASMVQTACSTGVAAATE